MTGIMVLGSAHAWKLLNIGIQGVYGKAWRIKWTRELQSFSCD